MSRDDFLQRAIADQDARDRAEIERRLDPKTRGAAKLEREAREPAPVSMAEILGPLKAIVADLEARMSLVVCRGDRENVSACFDTVQAVCPEAQSRNCPRRVLEYEQRLEAGAREPAEVFKGLGVPAAMAELIALGQLDERESIRVVDGWWKSKPRPRVLVLHGYSQIGKSVAAAKLVADWSGRFVHVPTEFCNRQRDGEWRQRLLVPSLMAFDDLGLERLDGFDEFRSAFDGVFCARVDAGLFTVITTNSASEIRHRYGDRVAERINRFGEAYAIATPGATA